jgi:mRNA interferase MazF
MVITKEETFGPVAPLYRFKTDGEAIEMANQAPTLTLPRSRGREARGSPPISAAATSAVSSASPSVCPIISRVRPFGTSVVLPTGLPVSGEILTSHVRSIDTLARPISYAGGAVPAEILLEVRLKLAALIGL